MAADENSINTKSSEVNGIPLILITGYLGAGKTTLLNNLLKQDKRKLALVVNDMGQVNVDAKFIEKNKTTSLDTKMIEMSNGCICCTLRDEFMAQIDELAKIEDLEAIIVEASGISDPASIAEAFLAYEEYNDNSRVYISLIATVVDADRIYREFLGQLEKVQDLSLNTDIDQEPDSDDPDIINLVMDQIEFCNIIILNKCDLLSEDKLERVKSAIRDIQPEAEIMECSRGRVDAEKILQDIRFDYDKAMNSSLIQKILRDKELGVDCDEEYGITSFVYEERRPFDRDRFMTFLEEDFSEKIIRSKGYLWFEDDPIHVQLMETAGRNASLTEFSNWVDAFDEKDKKEVFDNYPEVMDEWDPIYGDRMNQLVFIGRDYDRDEIVTCLDKCLSQ